MILILIKLPVEVIFAITGLEIPKVVVSLGVYIGDGITGWIAGWIYNDKGIQRDRDQGGEYR